MQDDWRNTNHSYNYQGNVFVYHLSLNMKCPILKPYNYIFLWGTERWWELLGKDTSLLHVWKKFPVTFLGIKKKKKSAWTLSKQMAFTKLQYNFENKSTEGPLVISQKVHHSLSMLPWCKANMTNDSARWNMATKPHCSITLTSLSFS